MKSVKFFSAAFLTGLYLIISFSASAGTSVNNNKNNNLIFSSDDCETYNLPCPNDDPTIFSDDTCNCEGDGSGGPSFPPDDKD